MNTRFFKSILFYLMLIFIGAIPLRLFARTASNFILKDLEGNNVELREILKSGPVLIDFWATWCQPCLTALPKLQEIKSLYESKGLKVVMINEDGPRNLSKIKPFLKSHNLTIQVLLDLNSEIMNAYFVDSLPATFLVDGSGEIKYFHRGYKPGDEEELKQEIEKLLQ